MQIPYVDLAAQHAPLKAELLSAVAEVIDSGQFVLGPAVAAFEKALAELCQTPHAIGVNSGTDALILALQAMGIGPGDEVITPTNSFVASASAIALVGAWPVLADVGDDYQLSPQALEAAITPQTKAVIPVHLTGHPAPMAEILEIAKAHQLWVLEDAAQAIRAEYQGQRVGSLGHAGAFSLHPLKTLNACGDGGALTLSNPEWLDAVLLRRNLGLRSRNDCEVWSSNSRLDSLQAAMLQVKLRHLESWTLKRRANAALYRRCLADIPQVQCPIETPAAFAVYHTFVIRAQQRDKLQAFLSEKGIGTAIHYPVPIHLQTVGKALGYQYGDFPQAEQQAQEILSLPIYPELNSEQILRVSEAIGQFYKSLPNS
jgi:dTDP-4-amino-4,6-dideoxygalactose transaminase